MSFRDLRRLTEGLRVLGYPRLVSVANFYEPNFRLVAEILQWLVVRYDPGAEFPGDVESEGQRVTFVKAVARFMMTKGGIRLNTKKLYRADGHSVKEMLKLVDVLAAALRANTDGGGDDDIEVDMAKFDLSSFGEALKSTRSLASEITTRGSTLHELLGDEVELREARVDALDRPLDVDEIESGVTRTIAQAKEEIEKTKALMDNVGADETNLAQKIEIKQAEIDRNTKRLRSLEGYRPPYMDEYEKYEGELKEQYERYIQEFRNLTFLENQVERLQQEEEDQFAAATRDGTRAVGFPSAIDGEEDDALASYNTRDDDAIFHDAGLVDGSDSDDEFLEGHVQATHHGDLEGDDDESSEDLSDDDDDDGDGLDGAAFFSGDPYGDDGGSDTDDDF